MANSQTFPAALESVLKQYPLKRLKKGQTLLYQGEVPRQAYIVNRGVVKAYNINTAGEEKIISFFGTGDILATAWLFGKSPVALYYYDAFSDCELYVLSKEELQELLSDKAATRFLLDRYVTLYVSSTVHINALEHSKSVDKIIHTLQYLMIRFGEQQGPDLWRIDMRLTHQDFASMIGLTRETIATELAKLKRRGVVSYFGQRYMVRTDKLQQMLGEDSFADLEI